MHNRCLLLLLTILIVGCETKTTNVDDIPLNANNAWRQLTAAIIEDGFSPPVAARIYAYSYLAQYEALALGDSNFTSYRDQLNDFESFFSPLSKVDYQLYNPQVGALAAFMFTSEALVYRGFIIDDYRKNWLGLVKQGGIQEEILNYSFEVGRMVADSILSYAQTDFYRETRNMPLYDIPKQWGSWEPTAPVYGTAIEPHWPLIRPFVLQNISTLETNFNLAFDTSANSQFYSEAMVVYDAVNKLTPERKRQAEYWDCNPRETIASGHMMALIKQMNPGGHWLAIGQTVMEDVKMPLGERIQVNAVVALAIHDAVIVCWNEKYKTSLIRPETYINKYIDPAWRPILETPLFPEFTSGHSVISATAATILTELVGDSIAYTDSVNYFLGLPPRSFESFLAASQEAAMSRMLGGIHYMPAITLGIKQGEQVADSLLLKLVKSPNK